MAKINEPAAISGNARAYPAPPDLAQHSARAALAPAFEMQTKRPPLFIEQKPACLADRIVDGEPRPHASFSWWFGSHRRAIG